MAETEANTNAGDQKSLLDAGGHNLDLALRRVSICEICHRPRWGLTIIRRSKQDSGLCSCVEQ
jgi:hypothetical protein